MSQLPLVATLYNPHTQTKQQLIDGFVVRNQLFNKLFAEIKAAEMRYPEQHLLIEGQRGMGKTTLLLRLVYEIENDAKTAQRLIPIIFEEEAFYRISRLFQLWEETAKLLAQRDSFFTGLFAQMDAGYDEKRDYERFCFKLLQTAIQKRGKKLILLIDNFSELCNSFSEQEAHRLREILMTCADILWIGATAGTLEVSFRYQHAFYEFFKKYSLTDLNQEETQNLLQQLAKINGQESTIEQIMKQQPERVETLRILTGGVIRTIVVLFEIFMDHDSGNAIQDLERILDRVTPLYKHRMDDLPTLQREVVTALAKNWDAMASAELAKELRRPAAEVETTLAELKKANLVEIRVLHVQTQWYSLQERFFNIWYLMRLAGARSRVIWLVRFLEAWYDQKRLIERAKIHIQALEKSDYSPKAAFYFAEALAQTGKLGWDLENTLKRETRKYLDLCDQSLALELLPADQELFNQAEKLYDAKEYEQARQLFLQIRQPDGKVYFRLGFCHYKLDNISESICCYLTAIEKGYIPYLFRFQNNSRQAEYYYSIAVDKGNVEAMFKLAFLYHHELQDYNEAEHYYLKAIDKGHQQAMFNLALLYENDAKDYHKAERYYLMAINKEKNEPRYFAFTPTKPTRLAAYNKAEQRLQAAAVRGSVNALFNLALLYHRRPSESESQTEFYNEQALFYYKQAIEQGSVPALLNLGLLYHIKLKDYKQAKVYYQRAIHHGNLDAMFNLALLYHIEPEDEAQSRDYDKAEKYYKMAIEKGHKRAMFNLALLYHYDKRNYEQAECYYRMALGAGEKEFAFRNLIRMYRDIEDKPEKAAECSLFWAEKGHPRALNSVAWDYFLAKIHKDIALRYAKQAFEDDKVSYIAHTLACIYVWHERFADAEKIAKEFVKNEDFYEIYPEEGVNTYLLLLLAKQQLELVGRYFEDVSLKLKDRFRPIYYAFLKLTDDPEFGRMPSELNETVEQVLVKIAQMAEDYK